MHSRSIHSWVSAHPAARIAISFALLALLLIAALIALVRDHAHASQREQAHFKLTQAAQGLRERLDRKMADLCREVRVRTEIESMENPSGDESMRRRTIASLHLAWPEFSWISFSSQEGIVQQSTGGLLEGQSVAGRPWFKRALNGRPVTDVHAALMLQELLGGEEPMRFVDIAYPVRNAQGNLVAILGVHASWKFAGALASASLGGIKPEEGIELRMFDREGNVLLGPGEAPQLSASMLKTLQQIGQSAQTGIVIEEDKEFVAYMTMRGEGDFPGLGWIVAARQSTDKALQPMREFDQLILVWGSAGFALFLLATALLSWRLSQPFESYSEFEDEQPAKD